MVFLPMATYRTPQSLIAMIRRVQSPRGRRREGLFSIEGTRLVERALRAGAALVAVVAAERMVRDDDGRWQALLADLEAAQCPIEVVPDRVLGELTEGRDLGPVLGLVRMPAAVTLAGLTGRDEPTTGEAVRLFLAAVDIVDPGNVGALTRTAHAAGASAFLVAGASDPYHPRATRISRGSIFRTPVIEYETAQNLLDDLHQHGIYSMGTAATGGIRLPQMVWPRKAMAVLMGNEAEGLAPEIETQLDCTITIPMTEGVDSFSVNAAAAIVLYAARQSLTTSR